MFVLLTTTVVMLKAATGQDRRTPTTSPDDGVDEITRREQAPKVADLFERQRQAGEGSGRDV